MSRYNPARKYDRQHQANTDRTTTLNLIKTTWAELIDRTNVTLAVGLARFPFNCGRCGAPVEHLQVCADTSDGRGICGDCIDDYVSGKDLND